MKKTNTHPTTRRVFLGAMAGAGTALGAGLLSPKLAHADPGNGHAQCTLAKPIPGGVAPFAPFAIFIHHNPLNPAVALASINDPSQITDFDGFVGLTHIRGTGTGTNPATGATQALNFQADMGFSQGRFIGIDGGQHEGTFAFV
jgi:hypothetical protein